MAWIRTKRPTSSKPPSLSRREATTRRHATKFTVSPAIRLVRDAEGSWLRHVPDSLLAIVSRFLSNRPETKLLEELIQAGRVPQPLLVELARASCCVRRLRWEEGKNRFVSTSLKCHRHHCRWRLKAGKHCITDYRNYTTAAFLKNCFRINGVPPGCWNQPVAYKNGRETTFLHTVLDRLRDYGSDR